MKESIAITIPSSKLKTKIQELTERNWDVAAINARYEKMIANGITRKTLDAIKLAADKTNILDRVQLRAEEYNYLAHNCPQGTALALLEEFGLGNMEAFAKAKGFEKCGLVPGIGARLAGETIIDSIIESA